MRWCALSGACLVLVNCALAGKSNNAIHGSKIKHITLVKDKETAHRRVEAIPQLRCIGGNARKYYEVDVMRCTNIGESYDGLNLQWTCKADLPGDFRLGSTEVLCEGYDSPDDPYILKGSCGVEYRLMLTPQGEATYGRDGPKSTFESFFAALCILFIMGVFMYAIYSNCTRAGRAAQQHFGGHHGGGGGGGGGGYPGDDSNDPPPPYTPGPGSKAQSSGPQSNTGRPNQQQNQQQQNGWGFWRGLAAGGAGGYAFGQMGRQDRWRDRYEDDSWHSRWDEPRRSRWSSPSSSSSIHESTGFGGTTRR